MPGMDLNQNNRNYERDVMAERVNRIERFLESFDLELVEPVEGANKIRVNKLRAVDGRIQQTKGRELDISAGGTGSGLPDGSEETPHAIWNTSTEEWEAGLILQPGTKHGQLAYWDATLAKWELLDAGSKDQLLKTNSSGKPEWTTGFTGTINRVTKIELVGLDLKQTQVTDTYINGLLISSTDPEATTIFTFENCVESPS